MVIEGKPFDLIHPGHDEGGEGAIGGPRRAGGVGAEEPAEVGHVAIAHHGGSLDHLARAQADPGGAPPVHEDLAHLGAGDDLGAAALREGPELGGEGAHAALHHPGASLLDGGDHVERGGGVEGGRAHVGGVAAEEHA